MLGGLSALGAIISGYLTWVHYSGALALCTSAGGCAQVQASRYAVVAGVPVAALGLALYLTLLGVSLWQARAGALVVPAASLALFGLALAGTLFSAHLTYLELFVIRAICPWCVASALIITAILALAIANLVAPEAGEDAHG
jgi:uncharacterized membrane protein